MAVDLSGYRELIASKKISFEPHGFADFDESMLPDDMFPHQKHATAFALRAGSAAQFLDTGLGKTYCALAWGNEVVRRTNKPVLMLAPLAVAAQHLSEAEHFGIDAVASREGATPSSPKIAVTNYERLDKFDPSDYAGVILDESSILKSFTGVTTRKLIEAFSSTPYRLACTATPAPNDHMELGQHSEFLGVLSQSQMLTRWFIHDSANTGTWRMKGHAVTDFWDWVASWARCISKPSDIGFSDAGFDMPELIQHKHIVKADRSENSGGEKDGQMRLFRIPDTSATSIHNEKRLTSDARAEKIAEVISAEPNESWIIWCDTDYEADALKASLPDAVEVRGSMSIDQKEERLAGFTNGSIKQLITKPRIAGYGLNWQHCARVAFVGLSFSYENYYQAVRRCWRFRQHRDVHVHIACSDTEASIWDAIQRKAGDHTKMRKAMIAAMRRSAISVNEYSIYDPKQEACLPAWLSA